MGFIYSFVLFSTVKEFWKSFRCWQSYQWRSQGAVAAVTPRTGQRQKIIVVSVVHTIHHNHIFISTRSVLRPRICRKCICGLGFALDPTGGAHDVPSEPIVGWGGDSPPDSTPLGVRVCPLHVISGYATESYRHWWSTFGTPCIML